MSHPRPAGTITAVPGIAAGHWTDANAATGCTVVLCGETTVGGVAVRGGSPGTRETDLLDPMRRVDRVHAILLSGGSAFGLAAANGVQSWLEERGIGFETPHGCVPIVPAAILYDLGVGRADVRPNATVGRAAAYAASDAPLASGSVGAGTGATVAKGLGPAGVVKGGIGSAYCTLPGGVSVGAAVAVNAWGGIHDHRDGSLIAGPLRDDGTMADPVAVILDGEYPPKRHDDDQHHHRRRRHRCRPGQDAGELCRVVGPRRPRADHPPVPHHERRRHFVLRGDRT